MCHTKSTSAPISILLNANNFFPRSLSDAPNGDGGKCVAWYELSEMSDFFDIDELGDDNGKPCTVLDTEECRCMMDDQNKFDIQIAFLDVRDRACREYKTEINPLAWMGSLIGGWGM